MQSKGVDVRKILILLYVSVAYDPAVKTRFLFSQALFSYETVICWFFHFCLNGYSILFPSLFLLFYKNNTTDVESNTLVRK